jgi:hypothetical protein
LTVAGRNRVRTYTRTNASGTTTRVGQHNRSGRGRKGKKKPLVSPGHAWKMFKKGMAHNKKKRRGMALLFGGLAVGEFAAWSALSGTAALAATTGLIALGVASVAGSASGWRQ